MIDWFVVLIPLALLPIFLLCAFVGCNVVLGLDEFQEPDKAFVPVFFQYSADIGTGDHAIAVSEFTALFRFQGNPVGDPLTRTGSELEPFEDPDKPLATTALLDLSLAGETTCTAFITLRTGESVQAWGSGNKPADGVPPSFRLERHVDPQTNHADFVIVLITE